MIRFRFYLDYTKEEKWLNEMARQGWELTNADFAYHFRKTEPQDTMIRIDYRVFGSKDAFINYCTLFEDSGWQHIAGSKDTGTQYFKRIADTGSDDIFSDSISRAERYRRVSLFWLIITCIFLTLTVSLGMTGAIDFKAILQPGRLYLTPGLWERSGDAFWKAFWFETPLALFRAILLLNFPISLAVYLTFAIKSHQLYQKELKDVS